jgi:O-6-methylguanine DNA methyltransferase
MDKIICIRSGKAGSAFLLSRTYPDFPEFFQTQKAMNLNLSRFESPLGAVLLVWEESNLRALDFSDYEARMHKLLRLHYGAYELREADAPADLSAPLSDYFAGDLQALNHLSVQTNGTEFQCAVWTALRTIPAGQTRTYGELATQIHRPAAVRAVGATTGANPVGIVVPCHRVIGANGTLTGYAGGIERKRWLLKHEGALAPDLLASENLVVSN